MGRPSNRKARQAPILFLLLLLVCAAAPAQRTAANSVGLKLPPGAKVQQEEGGPTSLLGLLPKDGVAMLIFLSARDPASLACAERLDKLAEEFSGKPVFILGISVNRNESLEELKHLSDEADWNFPVARDIDQSVARSLRARFTPEVMLLKNGVVRYAGPLDDCWYDARKVKEQPARQALEALLAGRSVKAGSPTHFAGGAIR